MFRDLRILNFRGFRSFQMEGLGRINLLVGANNCGKTTVLEAIDLLADYPDPVTVGQICLLRGGHVRGESAKDLSGSRIALRHLFFGRAAKPGTAFTIDAQKDDGHTTLQVGIAAPPPATGTPGKASTVAGQLTLLFDRTHGTDSVAHTIPLTSHAEWPLAHFLERLAQVRDNLVWNSMDPSPRSLEQVIKGLAAVALNPEEQFVLDVLRILEPRIAGITALPLGRTVMFEDRNGVFVKLTGESERVPIASLGDGVWRLLGLALALVDARGAWLLVDEIDSGLHYTAQVDMWRMVMQAAQKLDVQVFATTHSSDCIRALASLARPNVTEGSEITIQRIEGERAVAYNEREIVLSAERGIEVR